MAVIARAVRYRLRKTVGRMSPVMFPFFAHILTPAPPPTAPHPRIIGDHLTYLTPAPPLLTPGARRALRRRSRASSYIAPPSSEASIPSNRSRSRSRLVVATHVIIRVATRCEHGLPPRGVPSSPMDLERLNAPGASECHMCGNSRSYSSSERLNARGAGFRV